MAELFEWTTQELKDLPLKNGFRQRGMEMTRLETFADAAFAFAVTLLVVGGGDSVPTSSEEMVFAMKQVPAFAASFAQVMLFWYGHHKWSRRFGLEDVTSVFYSLLLVFVVLIYVYPLKAVYSGALDQFSGGFLESFFLIHSADSLRDLFLVFGIGYAAMSAVLLLLNRHALKRSTSLGLSDLEIFDTRTETQFWAIGVAIPSISLILTLVLPGNLLPFAGAFYAVFGIIYPWHGFHRGKQRSAVKAEGSD